ncbi:MAG TPA: choice-of-anchor L domain-containing protein [Polyangiaceae bacterium]|nr:choice-of-anchor L domain-containing protein [Polyangiaceae bacterium]
MRVRTGLSRDLASFTPWLVAASVLSLLTAGACAGSEPIGDPGGSGAAGTGTAAGGAGGQGGESSTTTSSSGSASGSGGGGVTKCTGDADCAGDPGGSVCDVATGECVGCLPASDMCPAGEFCDPKSSTCKAGCNDATDCADPAAPHCETSKNTCVECLQDSECMPGTICIVNTCIPGCSPQQDCADGFTCCGSTCYDITSDPDHCGDCLKPCETPPQAEPVCNNSMCEMGACFPGWADCDGDLMNGCEQNTLQDGPCACMPGSVQDCYYGAPGTKGVGPCKGGQQICDPTGLSWGACSNLVMPVSEICGNNVDEDCNGVMDDVPDIDGDGWTSCNGDCCETPGAACTSPKLVNPGAFEVLNNNVDDDCDAATSDTVAPAACSTVADFTAVTASDVANAMDICQTTTANPPLPQKKWGLLSAAHRLADGNAPAAAQLNNMQNSQTAILVNYGTAMLPKKGPTMAGISSGMMRDQNDPGFVNPPNTDLNHDSNPPAIYLGAHGGDLPGAAGCSGNCNSGSGANDSVNIRLSIRVPTNAKSFSYDFRFISYEYWTWSCSLYNDFYLALLTTGAAGIPADKNISFDSKNNPVSVNNGFFEVCKPKGCYTCPMGTAQLNGTGMGTEGGATSWLTTDAPVVPGETMVLQLMIFDVTDRMLDSNALLDNFRWNIAPATVNTHK